MFIGNQPERVQDLVLDFNDDLMLLTKKTDFQITKGVYLGDLFVQAENFQVAKNWLTKTYWQVLFDNIGFFDYFPDNLKKYFQHYFLNEQAYGGRGRKSNFNHFNNFNVAEVFGLIEDAQSEIASSIMLDINRFHIEKLGIKEGMLSNSNVLLIPTWQLAQSNLVVAMNRLKLLVLNILFIIDFVNGYKFDGHKFLYLNGITSENDLLLSPVVRVTPLLEKRLDPQGNILLIIDGNSARSIRTKLSSLKNANSTNILSESLVFSDFFRIQNTSHPIEGKTDFMTTKPSKPTARKSLLEFAGMTNKERKKNLTNMKVCDE